MNNGDMPATPLTGNVQIDRDGLEAVGLTKREAFAMAAMQGLIPATVERGECYDTQAHHAIEMANALLKALEE